MKVLIMGAGHQGLAMAYHLSREGVNCSLWNRSVKNIDKILLKKEINCSGLYCGTQSIDSVSTDILDVLQKIIMITTPSSAHNDIAEILAPHVDSSYTIVLNPGRTYGIDNFINCLKKYNCKSIPRIAETQTIVYTCRRDGANDVEIFALKSNVCISSINEEVLTNILNDLPISFTKYLKPVNSKFITSLGNIGMVLHCAPVLMNIGWIESEKVKFKYYYDGITPTIAHILEKLDAERLLVAREMGVEVDSVQDWLKDTYCIEGSSLYELLQNNNAYRMIDAPISLNHRYLEEDVPNGLVPLEDTARKLGIDVPVTKMLINLANLVMFKDYRLIGRKFI